MNRQNSGRSLQQHQRPAMSFDCVEGLISVVIPTYNRKQMVQEAIASVANQSWPDVEIIVVDDGSTDGTFECLTDLKVTQPGKSLVVLHQENSGVSAARNLGILKAKGEFVHFLDSDDLIYNDALESLVEATKTDRSPYALAHIRNSDSAGRILVQDPSGITKLSENNILRNRWMTHAALYRRTVIRTCGLFNTSISNGEDTEFQMRIIAMYGCGILLPKFIGIRRQHNFGHLSRNRTDVDAAKHSVTAMSCFASWMQSNKISSAKVDTRVFITFLALGSRLGRECEWQHKNVAFNLPTEFDRSTIIGILAKILGRPNSRRYYHFLCFLVLSARKFRDCYRFAISVPRMARSRFIGILTGRQKILGGYADK